MRRRLAPRWKSNAAGLFLRRLFQRLLIPFIHVRRLGCAFLGSAAMPSENLERKSMLVLKKLKKMDPDLTQNDSSADLVRPTPEDGQNNEERSIRDIKLHEWIIVLILCFINLINYMDRFTIAGILQKIQDFFQIDDDKGGLLQTGFVLSYMIFAPIFGYLGDRYSRRLIMAFGVFLWSLTTLIGSFMNNFWLFLLCRALVGIGEASYSTIAPTIISDLFVGDIRSKMLALFYFAIPVGSGLGYIVGSETAKALGSWHWGLRVTPALGVVAVVLIVFVLRDPERGQSEGSGHMEATSWTEDISDLVRNKSFMLSTAGFTCVAFVAGALAWWGPKFINMGLKLQKNRGGISEDSVSFIFGVVAMCSGILGVPAGSFIAQKLRHKYARIDAHICCFGLMLSTPMVFIACLTASYSLPLCCVFVFLGEFFLNLTWSIVADILLYVVMPTRRSTAEGFQLLFSHALGDAGSPYLIGVMSEAFKGSLGYADQNLNEFKALQYALFSTCFVEILGGIFFLLNGFYILEDKHRVEKAVHEIKRNSQDFNKSLRQVAKSLANEMTKRK